MVSLRSLRTTHRAPPGWSGNVATGSSAAVFTLYVNFRCEERGYRGGFESPADTGAGTATDSTIPATQTG